MFKKIITAVLATLMLLIVLPTKVFAEEIVHNDSQIVEIRDIPSIDPAVGKLEVSNSEGLGIGDEKEGIMLTLTMEDRKFDITVHGKKANKIFDARARENIASAVVYDHLKYNEYGEGAKVYYECIARYIR